MESNTRIRSSDTKGEGRRVMSELNKNEIVEAVKQPLKRIFEAMEKLDAKAIVKEYHNHEDFKFLGLILGELYNLNYAEFVQATEGAYDAVKEQKLTRETEDFNILSNTKVIYHLTGTGYQITKEDERTDFTLVSTMILSLIEGEWKAIHETEALSLTE